MLGEGCYTAATEAILACEVGEGWVGTGLPEMSCCSKPRDMQPQARVVEVAAAALACESAEPI